MKLHQLLAVAQAAKKSYADTRTESYQTAQRKGAFKGISRTYSPREEGGVQYPSESTLVQNTVRSVVQEFIAGSVDYEGIVRGIDEANALARADVVVNGETILRSVPVAHLLFLEKQVITNLITFIESLPTLDPDRTWTYDSNRGCYVSDTKETLKTRKVPNVLVMYEATENHPAQVKEVTTDVVEGTWSTIDLSGGIPIAVKRSMLQRAEAFKKAVILAREEANALEAEARPSEALYNFIFEAL
jgi:hypothetical protein